MVSPHVSRYQTLLAICSMNSHLSIHQWSVLSHPAACHRSEEVAEGNKTTVLPTAQSR